MTPQRKAAHDATEAAQRLAREDDSTEAYAAKISDAHQAARKLWFAEFVASNCKDDFAGFLADAHESEQDGWYHESRERR